MASEAIAGMNSWDIMAYEAKMLFELCRLLGRQEFNPDSEILQNAVGESACLHARVLVEIFLSKDSGKGDDVLLSQLLPRFQHSSVD